MNRLSRFLLATAVFCAVAVAASGAEPEPVKVRAAYHPGLGGSLTPGVDSIPGNAFFAKHGLDVEWIKFTSGPPEVAAMISGNIQFGYIGHGAHTLAAEGKIDIVFLNHLGNAERIFARKSSGIDSVAAMKGKTVATQLGTSGEVLLNLALGEAGMTRDDIDLVNMDMGGAVAAFISGQVDVIACWDLHAVNVQERVGRDNLNELAATSQYSDTNSFPGSWTVTPKYADENPDTVVRFVQALLDCQNFRARDYDAAIRSAAEFNDRTFADFTKTRDNFLYFAPAELRKMIGDGTVRKFYQALQDYFVRDGKVKGGNVDEYVRTDLMLKALDAGNW